MADIKFREAAKQAQAESHELTELIRITTTRHWVVLAVIYVFLVALLGWGCFGSIPTRVSGQGLLLSHEGAIYDVIMPSGSGRVNALMVNLGDVIKPGQVIAHLDNKDIIDKLNSAQGYLNTVQAQYQKLAQSAKVDMAAREATYQHQTQMNQAALASENTHLAQVTDLLNRKKEMEAKKLVNKEQLLSSYNDFYAVKNRIDQINASLIQDKVDRDNYQQNYESQLRELSLSVASAERDVELLKLEQKSVADIHASVGGVVTHIHVAIGDNVKEGQPLLSVATMGHGLDAMIFVPAQWGQRVKIGAEVLVTPETIKKAEYGSMLAKATQVAGFPSSRNSMIAVLHNENLVDEFLKSGMPIAIRCEIETDKSTPSGYRWTTSEGPDQVMVPGMLVNAMITVKTQAPITLIIPFFRHLFYGDPL